MTKKIVIDPGHGGYDTGAIGFGLQEKNINLDIALRLRGMLANTADISLTRSSDIFVSLSERAAFANRMGADLFVSLHVNAGGGTGFESFIYNYAMAETIFVRETIHKSIADFYILNGFPDRGMKKAEFAVLKQTLMPAVLLENLFIDNQKDAAKLREPEFLGRIAGAVAEGISKALNLVTTPPIVQQPNWAEENYTRLKREGVILGDHDLDAPVTWGEVSAIIARVLDKI